MASSRRDHGREALFRRYVAGIDFKGRFRTASATVLHTFRGLHATGQELPAAGALEQETGG